MKSPPFDNLIRKPDGNVTFSGPTHETLKLIAKICKFTYCSVKDIYYFYLRIRFSKKKTHN